METHELFACAGAVALAFPDLDTDACLYLARKAQGEAALAFDYAREALDWRMTRDAYRAEYDADCNRTLGLGDV